MLAYVIYNPTTGVIQSIVTASHEGALDIAANTPAGMAALAVTPGHAVLSNQSGWQVVSGALVAVVPTDAELLATAQASQLAILTNSYNTAKTANVAYMGTSFMGDADSQQTFANALTVYAALGSVPSDFFGVDANYAKVPMTLDQLKGLTAAYAAQFWTVFQRWIEVKQGLATASTVAAVQAVVW